MALPAGSNQSRWDYRDFGKPGQTISLMVRPPPPSAKPSLIFVSRMRSASGGRCSDVGAHRTSVRYRSIRPDS